MAPAHLSVRQAQALDWLEEQFDILSAQLAARESLATGVARIFGARDRAKAEFARLRVPVDRPGLRPVPGKPRPRSAAIPPG